jgi:hypothetical protein
MHSKYQVAIFNIANVMTNVKVFGWTDRQDGLTDSSTAICHPTRGIKKFTSRLEIFYLFINFYGAYIL